MAEYIVESGEVSSGIILENNSMTILDGGVASTTTVNAGGRMTVSSGGTATETNVDSGGSLLVQWGGTAAEIVENGGYVYVAIGANITFASNTISGLVLSKTDATVHSGTTANSTTVNSFGYLHVSSGGTANSTTVNSGGSLYVSSGGKANNTTVSSGGQFFVSSGTASSTTVNNGGRLYVSSGGTVTEITENGGYVGVEDGANVTFASNTISGLVLSKTSATIHSGTMADSTTVIGGGLYVFSGGTANSTTVNSGGWLYVSSGGTATEINAAFGADLRFDVASNTYIAGTYDDSAFEIKGGAVSNYAVHSGGWLYVSSGGIANSITVKTGGGMSVFSGGTATIVFYPWQGSISFQNGATVTFLERDANIYYCEDGEVISKADVMESVSLTAGQSLMVYSGGTANITTINDGGKMYVSSGGTAAEIVENGGYVEVADGADVTFAPNTISGLALDNVSATIHSGTTASSVSINHGGRIEVYSGGVATDVVENGGYVEVADGADVTFAANTFSGLVTNYDATVHSGTTANSITVKHGLFYVLSGGIAFNTFVTTWGRMRVSSGGTANRAAIGSGGVLIVFNGAVANGLFVNSVGHLCIGSGGTATDIIASSGAHFELTPSSDTVVEGTYDGRAFSVKDSVVSNYTLNMQGTILEISKGITANNTNLIGGTITITSGGTANRTLMNPYEGGGKNIFVSRGGTANDSIITSGIMSQYGGTANNTVLNNRGIMIVDGKGTANKTTINSGGIMQIVSGIADDITVNPGGCLSGALNRGTATHIVENGGYVAFAGEDVSFIPNSFSGLVLGQSATLHSGTTAIGTIIIATRNRGELFVYSGGTAIDTTVDSNGKMNIYSGGTASHIAVNDRGSIIVSKGGKLTGRIVTLGGNARITASSGAIIDFDLTQAEPGTCSRINNLAGISGTPTWTITTKADQAEGIYRLADGAARFDGTITVMDAMGKSYGTLTVGGSIVVSDTDYSLILSDDTLTLKVGATVPTPPSPYVSDGLVISGGAHFVESGEVFHDTLIGSGGSLCINSVGIAESATIYYRGKAFVSSGGTAKNVRIHEDGIFTVLDGGITDNTIVHAGATLLVSSGGTATNIIENGGCVELEDGAEVSFVPNTISNSILKSATLHSGTTVCDTTLYSTGKLSISGGIVDNLFVNQEGTISIFDGGIAKNIYTESRLKLFVSSGGTAENITCSRILEMNVSNGGVVKNAVYARCSMFISSGGTAINTIANEGCSFNLESGAVLDSITINPSASFTVSSGVTATNIIENGGSVTIMDGAVVAFASNTIRGLIVDYSTTLHSGTTAIMTYIGYGRMSVCDCGIASDTIIDSGSMFVSSGGTAVNTMVVSSGCLKISSGGTMTGEVVFEDGAVVSTEDGAILDFDVSQLTPEAGARVNNLAIIQGTPIYTLTVSDTQGSGVYTLAEGAAEFNSMITVQNTSGDKLATLTVDAEEDLNGTKYSLKLEDNVLSVTLSKLLPTENPADKETDDYLYDKKKGMNADAEIFETNIVNADTTLINVDQKFSVYNTDSSGKLWHNFVGIDDTIDFAKFTLEHAATLSFNLDATDATKFTVWSLTEGKDKKGNTTWTQKSLQSTTLKKVKGSTDYAATTKALLLNAGDYYVSMQSTNKKNGYALYNVTLSEDSRFYTSGDNTDDWTDMKENGSASEKYATIGTITSETKTVLDNWVGFGDSVDYAQFSLDSASKLSFVASATDATKFTVYKLTQDKKGKWSLKSLQSTTLKKAKKAEEYSATTKGLLLESGDYCIAMESTNAKKGGNAYYTVELGASTFYDAGDDGWNNYVYNKKAQEPLNLAEFVTTEITSGTTNIQLDLDPANEAWNNFVGFGDAADYALITLSADATLSFSLTATDAAKFTIYRLNEGKKAGSYTMKSLQATTLKKAKGDELFSATTKALSLTEGEYYICMQSTNAAKGGSAFYNVELNHALCSGLPDAGIAAAMDIPEGTLGMQNGGLLA